MKILKLVIDFVFWHSVSQELPGSIIKDVPYKWSNMVWPFLRNPGPVLGTPYHSPVDIPRSASLRNVLFVAVISKVIQEKNFGGSFMIGSSSRTLGFFLNCSFRIGSMNVLSFFDAYRMWITMTNIIGTLGNRFNNSVRLIGSILESLGNRKRRIDRLVGRSNEHPIDRQGTSKRDQVIL